MIEPNKLFTAVFLFLSAGAIGQSLVGSNHVIKMYAGIHQQDRRLLQISWARHLDSINLARPDFLSNIYWSKNWVWPNCFVSAGGGYAIKHTKFVRPFNHGQIYPDGFSILRYVDSYSSHLVSIEVTAGIQVWKKHRNLLYFGLPMYVNAVVNKSVMSSDPHFRHNKFMFDFYEAELYAELSYRIGRLHLYLGSRIMRFAKVDPVIFGDWLVPASLEGKRFDLKNYFGLRLGVGYQFGSVKNKEAGDL